MIGRMRRHLALAATALIGLGTAPAASAHSVLIATEPARHTIVEEPPERVLLRFNEGVESALGSIRVFDGAGNRVDEEEIIRPSPEEVAVEIDGVLARGTYTVAWRVISADSDPINGAFVFHVQEPGTQPAGIAAEVLTGTPALTSVAYATGRFFAFLFILLCAGGIAALVYALRSAAAPLHHRLHGLLAACAGALAVFALLGLPLQGAAAGGTGLAEAFSWDVVSSVAGTRFGQVALIQCGLALGLLAVALVLRRAGPGARTTGAAVAAVLAALLVATPPFAGHAGTAGTLAIVADIAHVLAAAMWVGGLAFVVLALAFALEERWPLATRSVPRFSNMAVVAVALLIVGGTVNGYLQVRTWSALWETTYGLLLLAKIALVVPLLGLGAFNNRYAVPKLRAGIAQPRERRRFLQTAGVELAIMVAIVGVTAVLVNAPPARTEAAMHGAVGAEVDFGDFEAHVSVEPGAIGRNEIVIDFVHHGQEMAHFEEVTVSATLVAEEVGPLTYEAEMHDHGTYVVDDADFGLAGEWELRIEARVSEFDLLTEVVPITIQER